jgi:hypothetical protein
MFTDILVQLATLETDYWYEVDRNWGREAHTYYVEDGVFLIGDRRMEGGKAVADFYKWRQGRGDRTARHLVCNFRVSKATRDRATLECVMSLFAADGVPVLDSKPAIMMADVLSDCVRDAAGDWRYALHQLTPIFMGGTAPTMPPKK